MKPIHSPNRRLFLLHGLLAGGSLYSLARVTRAAVMDMVMEEGHEHHHHHHAMAAKREGYTLSEANYHVPAVSLLDTRGEPVMLDFIFTSCGAICPVLSATFAEVQAALGPARRNLHMVSISTDPEYDTQAS